MSRLSDNLIALIRNPETPDYVIRDAINEEEPTVATVYVVQGSTGEYSSRRDWLVAAFLTAEDANAYCDLCNSWLHEKHLHFRSDRSQRYDLYDYSGDFPVNPYDPRFDCDYTGTGYEVYQLPLKAGIGQ